MAITTLCECDVENQTADPITTDCPLYSPSDGTDRRIRQDEDKPSCNKHARTFDEWLKRPNERSNQIFHYSRCIKPKRVTSLRGQSSLHCARVTQLLSKKFCSGGELVATLCPIDRSTNYLLQSAAEEVSDPNSKSFLENNCTSVIEIRDFAKLRFMRFMHHHDFAS